MPKTTEKTSVSLSLEVFEKAKVRAKELGFENSFSAYLVKLIRDDLKSAEREGSRYPDNRNIRGAVLNEPSSTLALKHAESSVAAAESALRHDPESQPLPEVDAPSARKSSPSRDTSTHPKAAPKAPKQAPE